METLKSILVINGPNLNLLGTRQPEIYGGLDLKSLDQLCFKWGSAHGYAVTTYQSNHEGEIIDRIHDARGKVSGIVLNAGAYTHTSYAIHDALAGIDIPTVEVHISNVQEREAWRRHSAIGPACAHTIYGRGVEGYKHAIGHLATELTLPGLTISYGSHDDQLGDLRTPDTPGPHPVMVLIHGGFWKEHWTRDLMGPIALDLAYRDYATWNIEYRRVDGEGGWPETFFDIASAVDKLAELAGDHQLDLSDVSFLGHSAGGQLALWAAGRKNLSSTHVGADPLIRPRRVFALAPVSDLAAAQAAGLGDHAVDPLMSGAPSHTEIYRNLSPIEMLPLGVDQVIVHGDADKAVPLSMSESYVRAAIALGDTVDFAQLTDIAHMDLIDPHGPAWVEVSAAL
jgi:3-dehydroquinate dehydratase type II